MILDIPYLKCFVRKEYLQDHEEGEGEFVEAYAFAVTLLHNRPLLFTVHTQDGAVVSRLPLSALCQFVGAPKQQLPDLQLWSCFGTNFHVIEHRYLKRYRVRTLIAGQEEEAVYLFSIDPSGGDFSEVPDQHKTWNILALENGNFAAQPNNRCYFLDSHFVRFKGRPQYKTNTQEWYCEGTNFSVGESTETFYRGEHEQVSKSNTNDE